MDKENRYNEWEKDFVEFLNTTKIAPPQSVAVSVKDAIASGLNPSPFASPAGEPMAQRMEANKCLQRKEKNRRSHQKGLPETMGWMAGPRSLAVS